MIDEPIQQSFSSDQHLKPKKRKSKWLKFLILVLLIVAVWLCYQNKELIKVRASDLMARVVVLFPKRNPVAAITVLDNNPPMASSTPTSTDISLASTTPVVLSNNPFVAQNCNNRLPVKTSTSSMAQWQQPEKLTDVQIFASSTGSNYQDFDYKVGQIISGQYSGADIIVTQVVSNNSPSIDIYHIIRLKNKYYYLANYSAALPTKNSGAVFTTKLTVDKNFDLPDLDFPGALQSISPPVNFNLSTTLGVFKNGTDFFCADHYVKVFTDANLGDVYTDITSAQATSTSSFIPRFGFYVKSPDGLTQTYQLDLDFVGQNQVPNFIWNTGESNADAYSFEQTSSCTPATFLDVVNISPNDLSRIGTVDGNQLVYEYADHQAQALQNLYNLIPDEVKKPSYDQFLASHPIVFWQDQFGQYVRFINKEYLSSPACSQ